MVIYRGWKFILLGMKRWRVIDPYDECAFDIIFRGGITELIQRVAVWEAIYDNNRIKGKV